MDQTPLWQCSDLRALLHLTRANTASKSLGRKNQHVYVWKAVYVGQCVRGLKGWEITSTKDAPGALDWVSLLPFLPLSLFHPPLPFSSDHFQHYPGTLKRLDHSFHICATNVGQQTGETNGIRNTSSCTHFLVIVYSYVIRYREIGQIIESNVIQMWSWWTDMHVSVASCIYLVFCITMQELWQYQEATAKS